MKTRSFALLAIVVLLTAMGLGPASTPPVNAAPNVITYDIWATDGYYVEADGNVIYMYGYVGAREGPGATISYLAVERPGWPNAAGLHLRPQYPANGLPAGWTATKVTKTLTAPASGALSSLERDLIGHAQFMGPTIYAAAGDTVRIRFKNLGVANKLAPNDPHTIHLHGLDVDAANDGVPETSLAAIPGNRCADGSYLTPGGTWTCPGLLDVGAGNVIEYNFTPTNPGTYMYHCHQEADIHVQMGMIGTIVIYNPGDAAYSHGGPGKGYGGTLFGQAYDRDTILMESEIDTNQHWSEELNMCAIPVAAGGLAGDPMCTAVLGDYVGGVYLGTLTGVPTNVDAGVLNLINAGGFNPVAYVPQYWQLNGLSFPQTVHVDLGATTATAFNWANWLAVHPNDDPVIQGRLSVPGRTTGTGGDRILIRMVNLGFQAHPMHMHGFHAKLIGMDQRAWPWGISPVVGKGLEQNTYFLGSGNTMEILLDIGAGQLGAGYSGTQKNLTATYAPGTESRAAADNSPKTPLDPLASQDIPEALQFPAQTPGSWHASPTFYLAGPTVNGLTTLTDPALGGQAPQQIFVFHNHDDYKATNNGVYPGGMFTIIQPLP